MHKTIMELYDLIMQQDRAIVKATAALVSVGTGMTVAWAFVLTANVNSETMCCFNCVLGSHRNYGYIFSYNCCRPKTSTIYVVLDGRIYVNCSATTFQTV